MRPLQPWSFGDPRKTAARVRREYAAWLLEQLPELPLHMRRTNELVDSYRTLTTLMVEAARELSTAEAAGFDIALVQYRKRRAQQLRTAWEVLHRQMVALEMRELTGGEHTSDEVAMVLLAERLVERLVLEIGDRP